MKLENWPLEYVAKYFPSGEKQSAETAPRWAETTWLFRVFKSYTIICPFFVPAAIRRVLLQNESMWNLETRLNEKNAKKVPLKRRKCVWKSRLFKRLRIQTEQDNIHHLKEKNKASEISENSTSDITRESSFGSISARNSIIRNTSFFAFTSVDCWNFCEVAGFAIAAVWRATSRPEKHQKTISQLRAGLGNLSTKNRLRDRFLAQNTDRLLNRDFQGRISDRKAEQVLWRKQDLRQSF